MTWNDRRGQYAGQRHDHDLDYASQHHWHDDLERDGGRLQGLLGEIGGQLGQLRGELAGALGRIRRLDDAGIVAELGVLDRLRPACVICHDATADRQTARRPACTGCTGDPPGDDPDPEAFPGPEGFGPAPGPYEPCPRLRLVRRAPGT